MLDSDVFDEKELIHRQCKLLINIVNVKLTIGVAILVDLWNLLDINHGLTMRTLTVKEIIVVVVYNPSEEVRAQEEYEKSASNDYSNNNNCFGQEDNNKCNLQPASNDHHHQRVAGSKQPNKE
ncbi:hypothetical protein RIR_jg8166.t1 [Rhizophagus irregularis DAOM 181602=DAOM 197198]|nr:hypothetical protein RIR_jg8166.t1 [Rhizophagus irregularis DAOM 181602=DAOM 197198]